MHRTLALLALVALAPASADAQLLSRASDAVRGTDSSSSYDDDDDDDYDDSSYDDDDDYDGQYDEGSGSLLGRASSAVRDGGTPYRGGGSGGVGAPCVFADAPYADGADGFVIDAVTETGEVRPTRLAGRIDADIGYALGGAGRAGLAGRLMLPVMFDLTVRYSMFLEPADDGWVAAALGRLAAELRVLEGPVGQLRVGGGVRHFHDSIGDVFGFDGSLGFDLFPVQPMIISGEVGAGMLGEAALVTARGTVGVIIDSTEIFAGYHYEGLFAGGQHVDLGGPILGLRAWL